MEPKPGMKLWGYPTDGERHVFTVKHFDSFRGIVTLLFPNPEQTLTMSVRYLNECMKEVTPKYVIQVPLDQTIGFLDAEGNSTTVHREARVFDDQAEAIAWAKEKLSPWWPQEWGPIEEGGTIYEVGDLDEFCSRPDTW